ncbi:MAG: hypothetical protein RR993_04745 [Clostridia bacterium]
MTSQELTRLKQKNLRDMTIEELLELVNAEAKEKKNNENKNKQ